MKLLLASVRMLAALTILTGVLYPLAVTGIGRLVFPRQARGSLIVRDGQVVGSALIGQPFASPRYFWSRPSATSPPYNAGASSGSNLGPIHPALEDSVRARLAALHAADPSLTQPIPVDLVTSSASGLDPHISVAAALVQAPRVARARGLQEDTVQRLVARYTTGRTLGVLGEPTVNVLELNLALDAAQERR
jgi:potassium-transporting ATPase KdpC subunit